MRCISSRWSPWRTSDPPRRSITTSCCSAARWWGMTVRRCPDSLHLLRRFGTTDTAHYQPLQHRQLTTPRVRISEWGRAQEARKFTGPYFTVVPICCISSGAGTNLKVGAPIRHEAPGKNFLVVPLHFLAVKLQSFLSALSWWSVQFGQFLVCCSFTHRLTVSPVPSHL